MSIEQYIVSIGFVAQPDNRAKGGEYSTLGRVSTQYKRGDQHITFGLGEVGLPPFILYPMPQVSFMHEGSLHIGEMMQRQAEAHLQTVGMEQFIEDCLNQKIIKQDENTLHL